MRVAVLGGGLQGICVAFELAAAGVEIDLYDRNEECMTQASLRNEGKIHLGFVYANDRSLKTARLMMRGASAFSPLMRRWLGSAIDKIPISTPFHYVVHRKSLLTAAEVMHHLERCCEIARYEHCRGVEYFGMDYREPPVIMSGRDQVYEDENVAAVIKTAEIAIDTEVLASLVRQKVNEAHIKCIMQANVLRVDIRDYDVEVTFALAGEEQRQGYDHVVNALWDDRLAVDVSAGIRPPRPWLFRLKRYVRVRPAKRFGSILSSTIVLGPFGDVVEYANGDLYLSWYPAGLAGRSATIVPPPLWSEELEEPKGKQIFAAIRLGLSSVMPAVADLTPEELTSYSVHAGVIFAWGETDIDDPASALHERAMIGPERFGRYHTINTGKLTMAPLFGKVTADDILGRRA